MGAASKSLHQINVFGVSALLLDVYSLLSDVPPRSASLPFSLGSPNNSTTARERTRSCSTWASSGHGAMARHAVMFACGITHRPRSAR